MSTTVTPHRPDATLRGLWRAALYIIVPPVAWVASLALSAMISEFTCAAVITAGAPTPEAGLRRTLVVISIVLLVIVVINAVLCAGALRRARNAKAPLMRFIAWTGVVTSIIFGFGIVLIGIMPFALEVC